MPYHQAFNFEDMINYSSNQFDKWYNNEGNEIGGRGGGIRRLKKHEDEKNMHGFLELQDNYFLDGFTPTQNKKNRKLHVINYNISFREIIYTSHIIKMFCVFLLLCFVLPMSAAATVTTAFEENGGAPSGKVHDEDNVKGEFSEGYRSIDRAINGYNDIGSSNAAEDNDNAHIWMGRGERIDNIRVNKTKIHTRKDASSSPFGHQNNKSLPYDPNRQFWSHSSSSNNSIQRSDKSGFSNRISLSDIYPISNNNWNRKQSDRSASQQNSTRLHNPFEFSSTLNSHNHPQNNNNKTSSGLPKNPFIHGNHRTHTAKDENSPHSRHRSSSSSSSSSSLLSTSLLKNVRSRRILIKPLDDPKKGKRKNNDNNNNDDKSSPHSPTQHRRESSPLSSSSANHNHNHHNHQHDEHNHNNHQHQHQNDGGSNAFSWNRYKGYTTGGAQAQTAEAAAALQQQQDPAARDDNSSPTDKPTVYVAGLFPKSYTIPLGAVGRGVLPAVEIALRDVNSDPNRSYYLQIASNDTMCDMARATRTFFDMMADNHSITAMLFGDACYNVTGPMVQIAHQWGMFQLSYADTNPMLSDRDEFPNFYRTVPSENDFNPARLALLRHFNWTTVGTLIHAKLGRARHAFALDTFGTLMERNKINISLMQSFADDPEQAVKNLKAQDARIIVCNFDQTVARKVFCNARKHELYGPKIQWIVLGTYDLDWWDKEPDTEVACTPAEMNDTLHGYLATDVLPLSTSEEVTESGKTPSEYLRLYDEARGGEYSKYHGYAHDGVWVVAKVVDRLFDDVTVSNDTFRGPLVGKVLNDTSFVGVTGRVQFLNGDRLGSTKILQMQYGDMVKVGEYHAIPDHLDLSVGDHPIVWRSNAPPVDRSIKIEELRDVSFPVYIGLVVIAAMGMTMAVLFLALNIHFRRHSYIKMSSPNMNNLIIVGCILCYQSIILLGAEPDKKASEVVFRYWCTARSWTLALGFTLAFGAMFGKTWRVHAIFTNIKLNKKVIKDYKLMLIVLVLVLLDAVILVTWQVVDPIQKATKRLSPEVYGDFEIIPKINYCTSRYMEVWLGALYAYKGLLLAFGCFLAWETRQVSIPALNDSKYIGMSVYNVVIMCVCGAALSFIIQDKPTTSFIIIGLFIIFCTTITLCLVFLPKIIQLKRNPNGDDSRVRATLRKTTRKANRIESSQMKERVRLCAEENRRLRGVLEQKVSDLEDLLHQLGDDKSLEDAKHVTSNALLHSQVQDYVYQSPGRLSIKSYNGGETDTASMYSVVSAATTTMFITEDSPVHHGRLVKVNRLHGNRMGAEVIEMAGVRYGHRKSSITLPPAAEEEEEDQMNTEIGIGKKSKGGVRWRNKFSFVWNDKRPKMVPASSAKRPSQQRRQQDDRPTAVASAPAARRESRRESRQEPSTINEDPFGGVYLGPDEPSIGQSDEQVDPKRDETNREKEPLLFSSTSSTSTTTPSIHPQKNSTSGGLTHHHHHQHPVLENSNGISDRRLLPRNLRLRRHSAPLTIWTIAESSNEDSLQDPPPPAANNHYQHHQQHYQQQQPTENHNSNNDSDDSSSNSNSNVQLLAKRPGFLDVSIRSPDTLTGSPLTDVTDVDACPDLLLDS